MAWPVQKPLGHYHYIAGPRATSGHGQTQREAIGWTGREHGDSRRPDAIDELRHRTSPLSARLRATDLARRSFRPGRILVDGARSVHEAR